MSQISDERGIIRKGIGSDSTRIQRPHLVGRMLRRPELGALSGAVLIYIVFYALARSSGMFSVEGIVNILQVSAEIGILAVAAALLMIAGEFDLSMGSMIGFASVTIGLCVSVYHIPLAPAVAIALLMCAAIGATNGWLTMKTGLPSFIVTLASLLILRGLSIAVTRLLNGYTQISNITTSDPNSLMISLFSGRLGRPLFIWLGQHGWIATKTSGAPIIDGLPASIAWWIGLTALATWVLLRTRFGNWIFAVGGDENAARNVGVPVHMVKVVLFMLTALSATVFAAIQVTEVGSADTLRGTQKEFDAIIAVVIGGTLLTGGYGSAVGAFLGALIYGTVQIGILYTGIDSDWFKVFLGLMVLAAVLFNNYVRRRATLAR
ncbi:MAG: simple sugar transport system permease protein [Rhodospirillaceae bacterium]|jgi:simple sugar transport system permease protein|nr:simple sugar transport system permease protein [Rhodospirillaceae bacterium]